MATVTGRTGPDPRAPARERADSIGALRERPVELLVIGGGVIGAGIARDAALRGLQVALVERDDLSSGTTSRPTRLIHGGLRYLELFDFGLVRSDMRERETLLRIAPHLVRPLPFLLPMYEPSLFERVQLRLGMQLYDILSFDKTLPRRRWLRRDRVLRAEPTIEPRGLKGAWRFYDAQVAHIERLVVENCLDAAAHGALVLTHAEVEGFERDGGGRVVGATVRDRLEGTTFPVRASIVVNATGPWLDRVNADVRDGRGPLLRLTKGVHLVTPRVTAHAHVLFARTDGRLFFVIPWNDFTLIGTTDTDYRGDPADAAADEADVRYLVAEARRAFPGAPFDRIHYTMAGVRALAREEGVKEGDVSRKHELLDHEREGSPGLLSVVGGKITAYRAIAEEVTDLACRKIGRAVRSTTAQAPLPGAGDAGEASATAVAAGIEAESAEHLVHVYGALAETVVAYVERDRSLAARLCPHSPTIAAELVSAVDGEWAQSCADALLRRTALGLASCQGLDCLDRVTEVMGARLEWDAARREQEASRYRQDIALMRRFRTFEG
jgi:glycerol-3-phosphate dehydrogenase